MQEVFPLPDPVPVLPVLLHLTVVIEIVGALKDRILQLKVFEEFFRDRINAQIRAEDISGHRSGGVAVPRRRSDILCTCQDLS